MKKILVIVLLLSALDSYSQELGMAKSSSLLFTNLSSHFKGNRALVAGYQLNTLDRGYFVELGWVYDYGFSSKKASDSKNNTQLNTANGLNYQINLGYKRFFNVVENDKSTAAYYYSTQIGFSRLNYQHTQLIPTINNTSETPSDICNCETRIDNLYQTTNDRSDLLISLGLQKIFSNGLMVDFSAGAGASMTNTKLTNGAPYFTHGCLVDSKYNPYNNVGNSREILMTYNNNGSIGVNSMFITQLNIKIGWAFSKTKNFSE